MYPVEINLKMQKQNVWRVKTGVSGFKWSGKFSPHHSPALKHGVQLVLFIRSEICPEMVKLWDSKILINHGAL